MALLVAQPSYCRQGPKWGILPTFFTVNAATMNICYLDYEAVLHDGNVLRNRTRGMSIVTPGRTFFEWMPLLEELLAPYPALQIVLSTTWVREVGFDKARQELSAPLRERVIGATFLHPNMHRGEFDAMPRGMQILGDVSRRNPSAWFALDDDDFGWPARQRAHLIQTTDARGLSDPAVRQQVRERLATMFGDGKSCRPPEGQQP